MAYFSGRQNQGTVVALDTLHHILCSATVRAGLSEFIISSDATPVEQTGEYQVIRTTSTGTTPAGSTTVVKLNTMGPSAGATYGGGGYTTEPTFTDMLMDVSVHQKATFRWVAYPGREIFSAPTASNGIGIAVVSQSAAFSLSSTIIWME